MKKSGSAGQAADVTIRYVACALHAGYLRLQTHTHPEYVILTASPRQQWLHDYASVLLLMHIACLVDSFPDFHSGMSANPVLVR